LKVLLIYLGRWGGGNAHSLKLAMAMGGQVEVHALLSEAVENRADWVASGLPVHFIPTYRNLPGAALSLLKPWRFLQVRKLAAQIRPDLVHVPMFHPWVPLLNRVAVRGLPKVLTVHDPVPHRGEENRVLEGLEQLAVRQSDRVIICSETFLGAMQSRGVPPERIDVVPLGVELFGYGQEGGPDGPAQQVDSPERWRTLLFFGRIREYKGLDVLLKAFPLVRRQVPETRLLIAGSGDLEPYRSLLSGLDGVELVNRWIGEDEKELFFDRAGLLVVPYVDASQSGVIPIAYARGLAVVATDTGGLREQVADGVSGLMAEPGDPVSLADRCVSLLRDRRLRERLAEGGRQRLATVMSWDHIGALTIDCYRKALSN
jgi:glycosyltransferase involved in cell wall biosynthesis